MFATLQTLLPEETNVRAAEDADESQLESLSASPTLITYFTGKLFIFSFSTGSPISGTPDISDPMRLVLQFAYVLLQVRCNSRAGLDVLNDRLEVCYHVGVFKALHGILTDRIFVQYFGYENQLLCFEIVFRLLLMFFDVELKFCIFQSLSKAFFRNVVLPAHVLNRNTQKLIEGSRPGHNGDDFCTVMRCLWIVFERCPNFMAKNNADNVITFLVWIVESGFLGKSPIVNITVL